MALTTLSLTNFRSYAEAEFELNPSVTLVVGPNASGKTNLLESLYVLATTRSFRAKDRDLVRHDADFYRIVGRSSETEYALGFQARPAQEKRVSHDGSKLPLSRHIGHLQVTLFEPTDLELVGGPPEGRRKYLDFILSQTDRDYLVTLQTYRRVLQQRNALLEGFSIESVQGQIFSWDLKLSQLAGEIYRRRQELIAYLNGQVPRLYGEIAGTAEPLRLDYMPTISLEGEDYQSSFLAALTRNLPRDLGAGFTTIGPHREDFKVRFKNNDLTAVASRGETRTAVLALKLAELTYADTTTGTAPLLLLDDVFSELDASRRSFLLSGIRNYQTVITTTEADAVVKELSVSHSVIRTGDSGGRRV